MSSALLDAALEYAAHGWPVFPIVPGEKRPMTARGCKDATTDAGQVRSWWTETPDANIGIATGKESGLVVLDIDEKPGKSGYESVKALGFQPTNTPWQVTQSGGAQVFFAYHEAVGNSVEKLGTGLDTRGEGGYVVAPPSQVNGKPYRWTGDWRKPLAPVPLEIIAKMQAAGSLNGNGHTKRSTAEWQQVMGGVPQGHRQDELAKVVGKLYASLDPVLARQQAHLWGKACIPPLTAREIDACCDRIEEREDAKGNQADFMALSSVETTPVQWLWPGYLPQGTVVLLVGDPDKRKTLVSMDLAARGLTGKAWPEGIPNTHGAASVIVLTAEDDTSRVVKPRLEAAGGDPSRVFFATQSKDKPMLSLVRDHDRLESGFLQHRPRLLIIDPISAYLPGIDTNRDNEVRSNLAPFVALAQRYDVTVIGIVHMSKNIE